MKEKKHTQKKSGNGGRDGADFVLLFGGPRFCFHLESGCVCLAVRKARLPDQQKKPPDCVPFSNVNSQ